MCEFPLITAGHANVPVELYIATWQLARTQGLHTGPTMLRVVSLNPCERIMDLVYTENEL